MIDRVLSRDTVAKWVAVIMAVLMWFQVAADKNPIETRIVNFDLVMNQPAGKVIVSANPPKVAVTLQGRASTLARLDSQQIKIEPDLSGVPVGSLVQVPVTFDPPISGIRVLDVNPNTATVELDSLRSKEVAVHIEMRGVPNEEYEAGEPQLKTESVRVNGPSKRVDRVLYVLGEIDVGGATSEVKATTHLTPKDAVGNDVEDVVVDPDTCEVIVPLDRRPPAKKVAVAPRTIGSPKTGYRVDSVTATPDIVQIRGATEVISAIDSIPTSYVNVSDRDASFAVSVDLDVPSGLAHIQTTKVSVYVKIVEDMVVKSFKRLVIPQNAPPGYRWDVEPREVTVNVRGRRDIVEGIGETDIQAYVDAEGKEEGSHSLPVAVIFADSISKSVGLAEIVPGSVTVTFTKR
ncbi:MAG: YbbR-like domain-containing protein [Bacillota bacterium]